MSGRQSRSGDLIYPRLTAMRSLHRQPSDTSLNSSYTDLLEASGIEIRDAYDGSVRGIPSTCNPVTSNLQKCKRSVIIPYYKMLSLIAWRPFARDALRGQCFWHLVNALYPVVIVALLIVWYVARVMTCQGRLSIDHTDITTPKPFVPTVSPSNSSVNWSSLFTAMPVPRNRSSALSLTELFINPCRHVFGTYIIPDILHFFAYLVGLYHFRIQENEGLYALMEKVYLQSHAPTKMTRTLRIFLYCGIVWLLLSTSLSVFFMYTFGLAATTGILEKDKATQYGVAALIVLAQFVANCVNVSVIINFGGQCQLLKYYIDGISFRLDEKTCELRYLMRDILDVKQNLLRLNGFPSLNTSFVVFNTSLVTFVGFVLLFTTHFDDRKLWAYRGCSLLMWVVGLVFTLVQAARLTARGMSLRERALAIRVFGYQTHTQLDIDSFLNFLHMVELEAQLFTIPVKPPYLFGILVLATQILILVFQTGAFLGPSKWF